MNLKNQWKWFCFQKLNAPLKRAWTCQKPRLIKVGSSVPGMVSINIYRGQKVLRVLEEEKMSQEKQIMEVKI